MSWAEDAKTRITALGVTPTADQARVITDDFEPTDLLAATISKLGETGGGGTPVSCVLMQSVGVDVRVVGTHTLLWDKLVDNFWDQNELDAIPAGLGLDFEFDGSSAAISTTETGIWSLSMYAEVLPDATWEGAATDGGTFGTMALKSGDIANSKQAVLSFVLALPANATGAFTPAIRTDTGGTENPLLALANLSIVRLG